MPHSMLDTLDNPQNFAKLDPKDMLGLVRKFPQQCREAVAIGEEFGNPGGIASDISQVVVTGLGGSAIGGDFARCLMEAYGSVPLTVNRDYDLPHSVGPESLVVALSYSGNTEETLSAYQMAREAHTRRAVITSGGQLKQLADEDSVPVALVPGGQPPRSATGYMFFPLIGFLTNRHLLSFEVRESIPETLTLLETLETELGPDVPTEQNPAKQLALALHGKLPVVYGSKGIRGAVAVRWKGQFNENAKQAAFANVLPEQNHNEILAWTLAKTQAPAWAVIFLRDEKDESPRIARRVEVTKQLVAPAAEIHEVQARGESLLARTFSLIYFADFVTVYLAYLNGVCPTEIAGIDTLKAEMAKLD
jgi:glucose/mannose-6-phosphate isomerase